MTKKACILLAEGFEEVEAITPIDYLRRAGVEVTVMGVGGLEIKGSHGICVRAETRLGKEGDSPLYDAIILPGGGLGAKRLAESEEVVNLILRHNAAGKIVAAICASPAVVLHGACHLLRGKRFTGFPGTEAQVRDGLAVAERVAIDGNLITSKSPGTAGEFAIAIASALVGGEAAAKVSESVLLRS